MIRSIVGTAQGSWTKKRYAANLAENQTIVHNFGGVVDVKFRTADGEEVDAAVLHTNNKEFTFSAFIDEELDVFYKLM